MTGCLNQVAIREQRGLCSMAVIAVATAAPGTCWKSLLVEVEGEELLYDSMLRYANVWMGGGGGGGGEGGEDKDEFFLIQVVMKGKKTCIMTTAEHYTLLCVYCFAGKHHSCCVKCCLSHDCTS